ncbi:MAG: hypothetical protein HRT89_08345 [Lentisphaeria bacterium]|nr:hypothetical protein [Lentisphaeria bacterium]NQZ68065.1 hypothetical protein [Lentisphaeria bacterium]
MVKTHTEDNDEKLERLIRECCEKYALVLYVQGWSRKTFDILEPEKNGRHKCLMARIESLAVQNGEILYFDDSVLEFCMELANLFEENFDIKEAQLIKKA